VTILILRPFSNGGLRIDKTTEGHVPDSTPGERSGWRQELAAPITRQKDSSDAEGNLARPVATIGRDWIRDCRVKLLADLLREQFGWPQDVALVAARRCIDSRTQAGQ